MPQLKFITEGLWIADGPQIRMATPIGGLPFPTRMVVVRLASQGLWVWSPIHGTPALWAEIDALGPVKHLVSPNFVHYASIGQWSAQYPEATAWSSPGVEQRAAEQGIEVTFHAALGSTPPSAWSEEIDQFIVEGSEYLREVVFFHRSSKTLILADLIINLDRQSLSPWMRVLTRLMGMQYPHGMAPLEVRRSFRAGREQAKAGLERMIAWQPDRVVFAHGRWYEIDAVDQLKRAFRWLK